MQSTNLTPKPRGRSMRRLTFVRSSWQTFTWSSVFWKKGRAINFGQKISKKTVCPWSRDMRWVQSCEYSSIKTICNNQQKMNDFLIWFSYSLLKIKKQTRFSSCIEAIEKQLSEKYFSFSLDLRIRLRSWQIGWTGGCSFWGWSHSPIGEGALQDRVYLGASSSMLLLCKVLNSWIGRRWISIVDRFWRLASRFDCAFPWSLLIDHWHWEEYGKGSL